MSGNGPKGIHQVKKHLFNKTCNNSRRKVTLPPRSQLREVETPLQTGATKDTGFSLFQAYSERAFFPGGTGRQHFHPTPSFLLLQLSSEWLWSRDAGSFLLLRPHQGPELLSQAMLSANARALRSLVLAHKVVVSCPRR